MQEVIRNAIEAALKELGIEPVNFVVEHPNELAHGDYASNVAMMVAKQLGEAPRQVAEKISAALNGQIEYVEKIEIAGPGFINFYLTRDFFTSEIERVHTLGDEWGRSESHEGEVVLVEYTSPNLFKPLHVGNLVGNIVGESSARLYEYTGAEVKRINFPSDIGLTVAKGVWGLRTTGGDPHDILALGEAYRVGNEAYEKGDTEKAEIDAVNSALYSGSDEELNKLRAIGIETSKRKLDELCALLGTVFDLEIRESEVGTPGVALVREHIGKVFEESEGAIVYKGEKVGLHTRVFINSKGLPTYEAKDLGNFARKTEVYPTWSRSLIVTGNEQAAYFNVLFSAIGEVFPSAKDRVLMHIPTGFLTLSTGKMSSRKGNVLTGESLLADLEESARKKAQESRADDVDALTKEVAVGALKYQILKHSTGSNIVFDKEKSLSFEGDSGPYLQYTHARLSSILEKAQQEGIAPSMEHTPEEAYSLERILYRFPEMVSSAQEAHSPHTLVTYLTELAGVFNAFYAKEKIVDKEDEHAPYKVAISLVVRNILRDGLWLLGIPAPERM